MIRVENLIYQIKDKKILDDISFRVESGQCLALIGKNGAGKTSLMSCLLGDKKALGTMRIFNQVPTSAENKKRIAVLPQDNVIPTDLKVCELLAFFRKIHQNALSSDAIDEILQFSDQQKNQLAKDLSGGQRRFLAFVLCLIGQPQLLLLDEPTAGMDTGTRQRFWEIINQLKQKGVTIIYSSHYIEEVEHTADRILVLHKGRLLCDTTPYAMRNEEAEKEVTLSKDFLPLVEKLPHIFALDLKLDTLSFKTKEIEKVWEILQREGCSIADMELQNKTLLNTLFDKTKEDK